MSKFKFKVTDNTTIDDVECELEKLKNLDVQEMPLNHILKITDFLSVEKLRGRAGGTGSSVRFRHSYLEHYKHYHQGYFKIDLIHTGKAERIIGKRDFVRYLLPPLLEIIKIKREKGEMK